MNKEQDIIKFLTSFDEKVCHLNTSKLISEALLFVTKELNLKRASVAILKDDHSGFTIRNATFNIKEMEKGQFMPFSSVHLSQLVQTLKPIYRADINTSKPNFTIDTKLISSGLKSDFVVPLISNGKCIGTLNCGSNKIDGISSNNRQLFILIAPKFAQSLQNTKLFEELRESEGKFKSLITSMDEIVFVLDKKNRFTKFYAPREKLLIDPKDFIGEIHRDVMPAEVENKFQNAILKLKKGKTDTYEYSLDVLNKKYWYSLRLSPLFEADEYTGAIAIAHDITEKKEKEDLLQQSEENLRSITENSSDHIMMVGKDMKIQFINRTVPDLKKEDVIGKNILDFVPGEFQKLATNKFKSVFKTRNPTNYQTEYITAEGDIHYFDVRLSPIVKDGKVISVISSSNNITERKKAEQKIEMQYKKSEEQRIATLNALSDLDEASKELQIEIYEHKKSAEELDKYRDKLEDLVTERTTELEEKNRELERLNNLFIGREFRIKELRDKLKDYEKKNN